jgi:phosphopantetheine adenylyltransferase
MNSSDDYKKKNYLVKIRSPKHMQKTGKAFFQKPHYAFFGSFDPFTKGHLAVYTKAKAELGAEVDFVIVKSLFKKNPTFSLPECESIINSYVPRASTENKDISSTLLKELVSRNDLVATGRFANSYTLRHLTTK